MQRSSSRAVRASSSAWIEVEPLVYCGIVGGCSSIEGLKTGHFKSTMITSVVMEFNPTHEGHSSMWFVLCKCLKVLFKAEIDNPRLAIRLRVVDTTH